MGKEAKVEKGVDIRFELERLKRKATRMEAVRRLGQARASEAVEPLLRLCERVKKGEREAIANALAQMGALAVKPLVKEGFGSDSS